MSFHRASHGVTNGKRIARCPIVHFHVTTLIVNTHCALLVFQAFLSRRFSLYCCPTSSCFHSTSFGFFCCCFGDCCHCCLLEAVPNSTNVDKVWSSLAKSLRRGYTSSLPQLITSWSILVWHWHRRHNLSRGDKVDMSCYDFATLFSGNKPQERKLYTSSVIIVLLLCM